MERESDEAWSTTKARAQKHAISLNIFTKNIESIVSVEFAVEEVFTAMVRWLPKAANNTLQIAKERIG